MISQILANIVAVVCVLHITSTFGGNKTQRQSRVSRSDLESTYRFDPLLPTESELFAVDVAVLEINAEKIMWSNTKENHQKNWGTDLVEIEHVEHVAQLFLVDRVRFALVIAK